MTDALTGTPPGQDQARRPGWLLPEAERHRGRVTDLLADLVHTPSLSTDEAAVVERLRAAMVDLGYDEVQVDPLGSVIGRIGDGPVTIVFDSHIDTVDVGSRDEWARDPFEPAILPDAGGGVLHGRGASDDKGGMAAMVHGAALYKELAYDPRVTLYVVGSVQEEACDGLALEHLLTKVLPRPDLVVLGEATRCQVFRGNRGRIEALVRVAGSSCHASAPERGVNPVYGLAPIVEAVRRLNDRLPSGPFLGPGTVALTKIECETPSLNAVPATATLYLDRRLTEGEDPDSALAELRALPEVQAVGATVELLTYEATSFTGTPVRQEKRFATWTTPADHPGVRAGLATGRDALDRELGLGRWVFSTNGVASMGKLGIPTIGFGPGDEVHAHTAHDQCPVDDLVTAVAWYAGFPSRFADTLTAARGPAAEEGGLL
jgi:putative selenium metabolism hydrolase